MFVPRRAGTIVMAKEPENLVLEILRDIRATLAEHTRMHAEHRASFAELREAMTRNDQAAAYAAGFALLSRRDGEDALRRVTVLEAKVQRLEERVGD
jgi:hypothetical protein